MQGNVLLRLEWRRDPKGYEPVRRVLAFSNVAGEEKCRREEDRVRRYRDLPQPVSAGDLLKFLRSDRASTQR